MIPDDVYHDGMRRRQEIRETRPLADRLGAVSFRTAFTEDDRAFMERCPRFGQRTGQSHPLRYSGVTSDHAENPRHEYQ